MSTRTTASHEGDEDGTGETNVRSRARETIAPYARNGSITLLVGGALLGRSIRTARRSPGRALARALGALLLLAIGVRQRRSSGTNGDDRNGGGDDGNGDGDVSAAAGAAVERQAPDRNPDENPRDVSNDHEMAAGTEDEGEVQFTREQGDEPRPEPELDEEGVEDPRRNEGVDDDDETTVDISEATMADEPGEAVGPTSEQAQPTSPKERSIATEDDSDERDEIDERDETGDSET